MTRFAVAQQLNDLGYEFSLKRGRLQWRFIGKGNPPETAKGLLVTLICATRSDRPSLAWDVHPWPKACRESEQCFGHPLARLYPCQQVQTPRGRGRLWQVMPSRVGVLLNRKRHRVTFFKFWEVYPPKLWTDGNARPLNLAKAHRTSSKISH